jgi:hypothetical protein
MRTIAVLMLAVAALAPRILADGVRPVADSESYEVYAAVLRLDQDAREQSTICLRETTGTVTDCVTSGEAIPQDWKDVLADYARKNAQPARLIDGMNIPRPYVLLSPEMVDAVRRSWELWAQLREETRGHAGPKPAPTVIFQVSAVGFDAQKLRAIVYLSHYCGPLCARASHWVLEKRDGEWAPFWLKQQCLSGAD